MATNKKDNPQSGKAGATDGNEPSSDELARWDAIITRTMGDTQKLLKGNSADRVHEIMAERRTVARTGIASGSAQPHPGPGKNKPPKLAP